MAVADTGNHRIQIFDLEEGCPRDLGDRHISFTEGGMLAYEDQRQ